MKLSILTKLGSALSTDEEIKRLEQVWLVLSAFFQDLSRRNVNVNVVSDLRDCKSLIHFIRTSVSHPPKETGAIDNSFRNVLEILGKVRSALISEALRLEEDYVSEWTRKIDMAERGEMECTMIHSTSEFVPGLPRDLEKGWIRLTLQNPVAEERVQDVAEQFGVVIEFKDDSRLMITGWGDSVKKAAADIYELSLE